MDINTLVKTLIEKTHSMVSEDRFETVIRNKEKVDKLEGDIVECGVWRGGFSIFLSHLFPERKIWMFDSFEGFQNPTDGIFPYSGKERHDKNYNSIIKVSSDTVREIMSQYELTEGDRIKFIPGYIKNTAPSSSIHEISLLRVDVDAYSATLEVLTYLYPKVVPGGMVIFDDSCIRESNDAIRDYFIKNNISESLYHPATDEPIPLVNMKEIYSMTGGYMFKQ